MSDRRLGVQASAIEPETEPFTGDTRGVGESVPRVSVILPVVNEEKNLPYVTTRFPRKLHEIIVVDGRSIDKTVEAARRLCPTVKIVSQTGKGKGNALACGFAACTGDIIVMLDGDGSNDAGEIDRFVSMLCAGADFVKGSRFISGGESADLTTIRRLGNWALTFLFNRLYGTQYSDLCYGFNAFWRQHLPALNPDCDGFEVETMLHIRAARAGLIVHEVPSIEYRRVHGETNLRAIRDGARILRTMLTEQAARSEARSRRPEPRTGYGWDGVERRSGRSSAHTRHTRRAADRCIPSGPLPYFSDHPAGTQ